MRVAHVISGLPAVSGGPSIACLDLARWQAFAGAECTILTAKDERFSTNYDGAREAGVIIREFECRGPRKLAYLPELRDYLSRNRTRWDIFVLHGSYQYPTCATASFCRSAGIPYIFTPHGSLDPAVRIAHPLRNRAIDLIYHDRVIRHANAWHFTSIQEREACERSIWENSFVEPLGIDVDAIPLSGPVGDFRKKHGIPMDATMLLYLSRITRKKGIDILLNSFRRLAAVQRDVFLALCGPIDDDIRELVDAARRDNEIAGRLVVTGLILGEEKDAAFFDANYFVLPTYSENFGIAVFEALAYGLPVLTTTGLNLHGELLQSGRVIVVEPNADALYAELKKITSVRWRPSTSCRDVRSWLEVNFSWRIRGKNLLEHYNKVLEFS